MKASEWAEANSLPRNRQDLQRPGLELQIKPPSQKGRREETATTALEYQSKERDLTHPHVSVPQ